MLARLTGASQPTTRLAGQAGRTPPSSRPAARAPQSVRTRVTAPRAAGWPLLRFDSGPSFASEKWQRLAPRGGHFPLLFAALAGDPDMQRVVSSADVATPAPPLSRTSSSAARRVVSSAEMATPAAVRCARGPLGQWPRLVQAGFVSPFARPLSPQPAWRAESGTRARRRRNRTPALTGSGTPRAHAASPSRIITLKAHARDGRGWLAGREQARPPSPGGGDAVGDLAGPRPCRAPQPPRCGPRGGSPGRGGRRDRLRVPA